MTDRAAEQDTPAESPRVLRSLREVRDIVLHISQRQIEFLDRLTAIERQERNTAERVTAMERTRWAPVFAGTVILLLTVAARLL